MAYYNVFEDCYHTWSYGILVDKTGFSYIEFLDNIKRYVFENSKNLFAETTIACLFAENSTVPK